MTKKALKGFSGLKIYPVTKNDGTGYTVGTAVAVSGAQSFSRSPETSDWKIYADDGIYDSGSDWQGDKVTLELAELPLEIKKNFEGGEYDEATGVYTFKSSSQAPELALSFKCLQSDGSWLMKKYFSFKASSLKDEHKTKGEGNDITPYSIEGTIMNKVIDQTVKKEKIAATADDLVWLDSMDV
jgi:phi13 family phage major tail protein